MRINLTFDIELFRKIQEIFTCKPVSSAPLNKNTILCFKRVGDMDKTLNSSIIEAQDIPLSDAPVLYYS